MSASGSCFGFGLPMPKTAFGNDVTGSTVPGDKILLHDLTPEQRGGQPAPIDTPVEPVGWRLLRMQMVKDGDDFVEIARFFDLDWIRQNKVEEGRQVQLKLDHMGVRGWCVVTAIEPCPRLATGPGRRVMGTFRYSRGRVYDLQVEGEAKPIRVTGAHPFWSPDRNGWVAVQDLQIGERLLGLHGPVKVIGLALRAEEEPVYNIEVDGDHVYRVGEQGLLVHNASADPCDLMLGDKRYTTRRINVNYNRSGGGPPDWRLTEVVSSALFLAKDAGKQADFRGGTVPNRSARSWVQNVVGMSCDTAGHVIGNQFGGRGVLGNVFPQQADANQRLQRTREDRIMSQIMSASTCRVCIKVSLSYNPAAAANTWYRARPISVLYRAWVDGAEFQPTGDFPARIPNPPCR